MTKDLRRLIQRYKDEYTEFDDIGEDDANAAGFGEDRLIHFASRYGPICDVEILLAHGADPFSKGDMAMTPLHWAAAGGHLDIVRLLLKEGALVDQADEFGDTPRAWAARNGHEQIVQELEQVNSAR